MISEQDVMNRIKNIVAEQGSQKSAAEKLGISLQYLNDYLGGRRYAGAKILSALELRRVVFYESTLP